MCTVSFAPTQRGFIVAMNRDEKRARVAALLPQVGQFEQTRVILPREPNGGTWIAVNDAGICLALINWHRIKREPASNVLSRGEVILRLIHSSSSNEIIEGIASLPLNELRPFRLIAILPYERDLTEWQWDLRELEPRSHPWSPKHWFSSGYDELKAEAERQHVCQTLDASEVADLTSLRRLHQSHLPERGPFSICMHRSDAKTVSYTEVILEKGGVTMRYQPGSPCKSTLIHEAMLPIRQTALAV